MLKKLALLTISIALYATSLFCVHDYDAPIPAELKTKLDKNHRELSPFTGVRIYPWLPEWFIKPADDYRSPNRIEGAKLLSQTIEELKCSDTIIVPEKYSYIDPKGHKFVIARKHIEDKDALLTRQEAKDLFKVSYIAKHNDMFQRNFLKDTQGKVVVIDSEMWSSSRTLDLLASSMDLYADRSLYTNIYNSFENNHDFRLLAHKYIAAFSIAHPLYSFSKLDKPAENYLQHKAEKYKFALLHFPLFLGLKKFSSDLLENMAPVN